MPRQAWSPTDEIRARVREMAACGYTQRAIAAHIGCSQKTLAKHCRQELDLARQDLEIELHGWAVGSILGRDKTPSPITDDRARVALYQFYTRKVLGWHESPAEVKHPGKVERELGGTVEVADLNARERNLALLTQVAERLADRAAGDTPGAGAAVVPSEGDPE